MAWTREYKLENQRIYRIKTGNRATKEYEKTVNGFLMRAYRNMQSRVTGVQKLKAHLYLNKFLLSREHFYLWARNNSQFQNLYQTWKSANYDRKLTPSVNRINSDIGYTTENIEWITHSENSRLGSLSKHHKLAA